MSAKNAIVRYESTVPSDHTTNANGSAVYIGDMDPTTVQFCCSGTASASFKYQVSPDGTNWYQCGSTLVETTAFSDLTPMYSASSAPVHSAAWVRLTCSAHVSITSVKLVASGMPYSL